jgi:uracil-DNA glycosylase family protein
MLTERLGTLFGSAAEIRGSAEASLQARRSNSTTNGLAMAESLSNVEEAAAHCTRCSLYINATQTVFGEGPATAAIMMVGEQPGDKEDIAGRPFVGPAGQVLDRALAEIGLDRGSVYVTNAVKHFKNEPRGKRRLHKRPERGEIQACRWWLDLELGVVKPKLVVALGATAAFALMGRTLVLARERGRLLRWSDGRAGLATIHPSAILRMPDEAERREAFFDFAGDLREALRLANTKIS